jgi:hypothetical protein
MRVVHGSLRWFGAYQLLAQCRSQGVSFDRAGSNGGGKSAAQSPDYRRIAFPKKKLSQNIHFLRIF